MRWFACLSALGLALMTQTATAADCRQALALGLDVSGSVNAQEYRLQLDGLAAALTDPDVENLILAVPSAPIRLLVYEWSGPQDQRVLIDWTEINATATLADIHTRLTGTRRRSTNPATALGTAMLYGAESLAAQPACLKHTLDISGDGQSNSGPRPQDVVDDLAIGSVTINALVIGSDAPDGGVVANEITLLQEYYQSLVIRGHGAFVQTVLGFTAYQDAMTRKLLREVEGMALSRMQPLPSGPGQ